MCIIILCRALAYKPHEVEHELSELEDLLYETMNEIWRSRVPAAIEEGSYLLDPLKVMNMFAHLANFFGGTNEALHEEGCLLIIRTPAFLPLVANVMIKQIEGKIIIIAIIIIGWYLIIFVWVLHPRCRDYLFLISACVYIFLHRKIHIGNGLALLGAWRYKIL